MSGIENWERFQRYFCRVPLLDLTLDVSRMKFDGQFLERMAPAMA